MKLKMNLKSKKNRENTINGWVREKDKIYELYHSNTRNGSVKKIMTSTRRQVDAALLQWFTNLRYNSVRVTGSIMIEKANQFATQFGLPATYDPSYIYRWIDSGYHGNICYLPLIWDNILFYRFIYC